MVLTNEQVAGEVARLSSSLRQRRGELRVTTRDAAARAQMNQGTLWRLESGQNAPRLWPFGRLAHALGLQLELDDGRDRPRLSLPAEFLWPGGRVGYWPSTRARLSSTPDADRFLDGVRQRIGAELRWARTAELDPALTQESACELLGMSHHTLRAVEVGLASMPASGWPYLTSIIRVAGLTGRRVELCDLTEPSRIPPWLDLSVAYP